MPQRQQDTGPTTRRGTRASAGRLGRLLRRMAAGAAAAVLLGGAAQAQAQEAAPAKKPGTIRVQELVVEGKIQKPTAYYILPRSNLNYESLERTENFLPKISEPLEKELK